MDKNKQFLIEAISGLVVLIALIAFAVWLIVRNGSGKTSEPQDFTEEAVEAEAEVPELMEADTGKDEATDGTQQAEGIDLNEVNRKKSQASKAELPQVYTPGAPLEWTGDNYQMPELFNCWANYELDAVSDIVKLERFRKITDSLKNNDYYYYGEKDADGKPHGKGLAVYANNTYYYGEFSHGLREGEGMWVRLFIDEPGVVGGIEGVTWHQYSGKWANDYPNGEGQENIQYAEGSDIDKESYAVQNAIGSFADGLYNGDMYIMTRIGESTIDWYGKAKKGVFEYIGEKKGYKGKRAIWKAGDGYESGEEDNCRWILPADNADFGIPGLKKA